MGNRTEKLPAAALTSSTGGLMVIGIVNAA